MGQFLSPYRESIVEALQRGILTEAEIDKAIRGNLYTALKLGLLDGPDTKNPYLQIGQDVKQDKQSVTLTVPVKNTGSLDGDEVIQVYATYPESRVSRPNKQLCAFARVNIKAGETSHVTLTINKEDLSYWDESRHAFVCESLPVKFLIGASSEDIRQTAVVNIK